MPQERNRVTLADEKDQYGLPVARVTFSLCDNDKRLVAHSLDFMTLALEAAGARDVWRETDDTSLNGTARMGDDPARVSLMPIAEAGTSTTSGSATAPSFRRSAA